MKKKVFGVAFITAMAVAAGWNINQSKNVAEMSDLTLENIEALAEGRGSFPACQKNEGSGTPRTIPFCVNGACKQTMQKPGTLDVNYCSQ